MARLRDIVLSEDDRLEEIMVRIKDSGGGAISLAIYSTIRLIVRLESGGFLTDDSSNPFINATLDDIAGGIFHFVWPLVGVPSGRHTAVIKFVDLGGKTLTIPPTKTPLNICVGEDL